MLSICGTLPEFLSAVITEQSRGVILRPFVHAIHSKIFSKWPVIQRVNALPNLLNLSSKTLTVTQWRTKALKRLCAASRAEWYQEPPFSGSSPALADNTEILEENRANKITSIKRAG